MKTRLLVLISSSLALQMPVAAWAQDGFSGTYQPQQPAQWQPLAPQQGYGQLGLSDWQTAGGSSGGNSAPVQMQQQLPPNQEQYQGYAAQQGAQPQYQGQAGLQGQEGYNSGSYQGQAGYQAQQPYSGQAGYQGQPEYQGQMPVQQGYGSAYQGPYAPQQGQVSQTTDNTKKPKSDHSGLKKAAVIAAGVGLGVGAAAGAVYLINRAMTPTLPYYPYYYPYRAVPYVPNPLGWPIRF